MDQNKVGTMMQSAAKVPISELNECITCKLCRGYFIDATTIIECLHTFCRSCIVRYLESNKYCPICDVQVHKTKPLLNLRPDKTIQDLVYKLVPRLYQNEIQRRKAFSEAHPEGMPTAAEQTAQSQYDYILAPEEVLNITLHYHGCGAAPRYLRCPSAVLVTHLKRLIRAKYELTEHHRVDVFYNQDCLNPSFSLMDISYIYSWKRKDPLDLTFKIYECRAKRPKLDATETGDNIVNNSANNNNNNNWKEVQLRISETGEMSITGIEDSSMLDLLDATENFKSEIVINEGKNLENFPKPIPVGGAESDVKVQANHSVGVDSHVNASENAPSTNKEPENAQKPVENHSATPKKELPGLKFIGKSSTSTTSTLTSTKSSCAGTKVAKTITKTVNSGTKSGNSAAKTANSNTSKTSLETRKSLSASSNSTEAVRTSTSSSSSTKTSSTKSTKTSSDSKLPKTSVTHAMPKSMELSATLNLNSELSVIPLSASTSCVSLSSCGGTTTVFSTINKTMCSTRMDCGDAQNSGSGDEKIQGLMINSNEGHTEIETDIIINSVPKETKNLKRKCEDDGKTPEVPTKLPKPTILNHSIGLMNLSNNHPLKKHSKMNRNGEHLLRAPELNEKVPISTPTLTVNHVFVPQKHIAMDSTPSKPIIINKNVSSMQINRPGTPKSGQKGGQEGNVPCYANKTLYNSVGGLTKLLDRNGEKHDALLGKSEMLNSTVNSIPKSSLHHPIHQAQSYQTSHHTPIITPSQLHHHQHLNPLQLKTPACSNSAHNQDKPDQKFSQSNVATSQFNTATSQIDTSQSKLATSLGSMIMAQSMLKASMATSILSVTSDSITTVSSQKRGDVAQESSQPSIKHSKQTATHSAATNQLVYANSLNSTPASIHNTPSSQTPPSTVATPPIHAPALIKTKPSTPIGYKTLRDPPKSWNSQINSQIARVNQSVKAQQLANAAAAACQGGGVNAQGRFTGDLKSVRPAKFFKGRNMPRYLGCPVSGVKPMYQVQAGSEKDKPQDQLTAVPSVKPEKSEIKKHSIVKIDPKTLRPISEKAPEMSNLSNISSNLNASQNNQELRINSSPGDLKINTSSVSIFNPLKLQSSPKSGRKSPKSPHSPKVKGSPNGNNALAVTTSTAPNSPSPSNTLSPKQHRDKTNLTFTPPNPFVPNLTSPTLSPNQFLYPAGGFPSYDPRVMAAYHSLWYTQRMAAAAAAGFVPPPMPHAFGMNMGLNTGTTTIGQQQHNPAISPKHSTPPKGSGQDSPRGSGSSSAQISKASSTPPTTKKTKELHAKNEKSLETALNKLSQSKAKELVNNKQQLLGAGKKVGGGKESGDNSMPADAQRSASPKVLGASKMLGGQLGDPLQRTPTKVWGGGKKMGESAFASLDAQQSRASPNDSGRSNSAMSALEKLSQNKAIEIVGGDVGGKKTPMVRGGRNSPMGGGVKAVLGGARTEEAKDELVRGCSTPPLTENQFLSNETIKRQSPLATESNSGPQTVPPKKTGPSTSSQDVKMSLQTQRKVGADNTSSTQTSSIPSELKTTSSELQTRLGQCHAGSNDSLDRSETGVQQSKSSSEEVPTGPDHGQHRSDQVDNRLEPDQTVKNTHQDDSSKCEGASNELYVTFSDKTDKVETNDEKRQLNLDSSDIKASSSTQISSDTSQSSSAKDDVDANGTGGNAAIVEPSDNVANQTSIVNVASGGKEVPAASGNNGEIDALVVPVVAADGVDVANKSDSFMESDKGGGEKM